MCILWRSRSSGCRPVMYSRVSHPARRVWWWAWRLRDINLSPRWRSASLSGYETREPSSRKWCRVFGSSRRVRRAGRGRCTRGEWRGVAASDVGAVTSKASGGQVALRQVAAGFAGSTEEGFRVSYSRVLLLISNKERKTKQLAPKTQFCEIKWNKFEEVYYSMNSIKRASYKSLKSLKFLKFKKTCHPVVVVVLFFF